MLKDINVRFFAYDDLDGELDIVEINESLFQYLAGNGVPVSYERHSIPENGCRQVCLTVGCDLDGDLI